MTSVVMTGRRMKRPVKFMTPPPGRCRPGLDLDLGALAQPELAVGDDAVPGLTSPLTMATSPRSGRP